MRSKVETRATLAIVYAYQLEPAMSAAASPPVPARVPDELSAVPAGALLAWLLEEIDVELVSGFDAVEVLRAEYRLWCRQTAWFLRAVLETGLRGPFSIDTVERVERLDEPRARAFIDWTAGLHGERGPLGVPAIAARGIGVDGR